MRILEDTADHLRLRESSGLLPAILMAAAGLLAARILATHGDPRFLVEVGLFALSAVFFRRVTEIDLDKAARCCRLFRIDMWRRSTQEIAFDRIDEVQVELARPDTGAMSHSRLVLATASGPIPLTAGYRPGLDGQIALREAMTEVIFKGRPRPAPLDPARLLAQAGRLRLAAQRIAQHDGVSVSDAWARARAMQDGQPG